MDPEATSGHDAGQPLPHSKEADLRDLRLLDEQISRVTDINDLKPVYYKLEDLSGRYASDSEMLAVISSVKDHMIGHGQGLLERQQAPAPGSTTPTQTQMPAVPAYPLDAGEKTTSRHPIPAGVAPPAAGFNWKLTVSVGVVVGLLIGVGALITLHKARKSAAEEAARTRAVSVEVRTNPPGASIRVNNQVRCTSNCSVPLPPGAYEIQAVLAGYGPASTTVNVTPGTPAAVDLALQALPISLRLFTDLTNGKVAVDDAAPADLQEGQLMVDVAPGPHKVKVTSPIGEAEFAFQAEPGKVPQVQGPLTARNMLAILVANYGSSARLHVNTPGLAAAVDSQPVGAITAEGLSLANLQAGGRELTLGEGKDLRKLSVEIGPTATMTAFLKLDLNAGTLVVVTGENDVTISLNKVEMRRKTQGGMLRLYGLPVGKYVVRVAKEGFEVEAPQTAEVRKAEEIRVEFKLREIPKFAALRIRGAVPGTAVVLDRQSIGTVQPDGTLSHGSINPGEHVVELRRDRFTPRRITRQFRAGETVDLGGADVSLEQAAATIRINVTPGDSRLTIKRSDEPQPRPVTGNTLNLAPGNYTVTARAPGFVDKSATFDLAAGETRTIDLGLEKRTAVPPAAAAKAGGTMADWENPGGWVTEGQWQMQKGGNYVLYRLTPTAGTFSFTMTLFRGRRLQWFFGYQDQRNHVLFQLDRKNFYRRDVVGGRSNEFKVAHELDKQVHYTVQIEVTPASIVHRFFDGEKWSVVDAWTAPPGRDVSAGKFGMYIPGSDQYGLANFKFQAK